LWDSLIGLLFGVRVGVGSCFILIAFGSIISLRSWRLLGEHSKELLGRFEDIWVIEINRLEGVEIASSTHELVPSLLVESNCFLGNPAYDGRIEFVVENVELRPHMASAQVEYASDSASMVWGCSKIHACP